MGGAVEKVVGKVVGKKARTLSRRTRIGIAVIAACLAGGGIWRGGKMFSGSSRAFLT